MATKGKTKPRKKTTTKKPVKKPVKKGPGPGRQRNYGPGYSQDEMPERATSDMQGAPVPRATASGRQEGVTAPRDRAYTAQYEAVDATTAVSRAIARQAGKMAPITGGLDEEENDMREGDFDPLGDPVPLNDNPEPGSDALLVEEQALAGQAAPHGGAVSAAPPPPAPVMVQEQPAPAGIPTSVLTPRIRVSMELSDGVMTMPAIRILPCQYGITILLPLTDGGVTFIPKPGSSVTIGYEDKQWPCFFPGTYFEWPELNCMGLVFVRKNDEPDAA